LKVLLLAAGRGNRLMPITKNIPKCLAPINEVPLIDYWFSLFRKYNIDEILINTHYLSENINNYIKNHVQDLKIKVECETELLGSLGSILKYLPYFSTEKYLLTFYSDNLTNLNIKKFITFHESHDLPCTIGLFRCEKPEECGIATLNDDNIVIDFIEKPKNSDSNLANAGIYAFDLDIFNQFELNNNKGLLDIAYDLIPQLVGQMKAFIINDFILDIGTHENYKKANDYITLNPNIFKLESGK